MPLLSLSLSQSEGPKKTIKGRSKAHSFYFISLSPSKISSLHAHYTVSLSPTPSVSVQILLENKLSGSSFPSTHSFLFYSPLAIPQSFL